MMSAIKLIFFTLLIQFCLAGLVAAKPMSVQVKEAPLRETPSFLGKIIGTCAYGDQVEAQQNKDAWVRVASGNGTVGWMHNSALSSKRIVLASNRQQAQVAASGDELALAGKGFNSEVEAQFKAKHKNIDFAWINRMEAIRISAHEKQNFLQNGGLKPPEGGAR